MISRIRQASLISTLLSNRSQSYAMMNEWEKSLADAASSLIMQPGNANIRPHDACDWEEGSDGEESDGNGDGIENVNKFIHTFHKGAMTKNSTTRLVLIEL